MNETAITTKITSQVILKLWNEFTNLAEKNSLRRDAFLWRIIDEELPVIAKSNPNPNSDEAKAYLKSQLSCFETKTLSLNISKETLERIDIFVEQHNIHRDNLINRILFFLVGDSKLIDKLVTNNENWQKDTAHYFDNDPELPQYPIDFFSFSPLKGLHDFFQTDQGLEISKNGLHGIIINTSIKRFDGLNISFDIETKNESNTLLDFL